MPYHFSPLLDDLRGEAYNYYITFGGRLSGEDACDASFKANTILSLFGRRGVMILLPPLCFFVAAVATWIAARTETPKGGTVCTQT
jgi:hypothetical protein